MQMFITDHVLLCLDVISASNTAADVLLTEKRGFVNNPSPKHKRVALFLRKS